MMKIAQNLNLPPKSGGYGKIPQLCDFFIDPNINNRVQLVGLLTNYTALHKQMRQLKKTKAHPHSWTCYRYFSI